jgi:hypothetical protein
MAMTHADDQLARELLTAASAFTGEVISLSASARVRRPELAAHLEDLAAEVAGSVLDAVSAWPVSGRRVS